MNENKEKAETILKLSNLTWQRKLNRNSPAKKIKKKESVSKSPVENDQNIHPENDKRVKEKQVFRPKKDTNAVIEEKQSKRIVVKSFERKSTINDGAESILSNDQNSNYATKHLETHQNHRQKKNYSIFDNDEKENFADKKGNTIQPNYGNNPNRSDFKTESRENDRECNNSLNFNDSPRTRNSFNYPPNHKDHIPSRGDNNRRQNHLNQVDCTSNTPNENFRHKVVYEKIFSNIASGEKKSKQKDFAINNDNTTEEKSIYKNREHFRAPIKSQNFNQVENPNPFPQHSKNQNWNYRRNESPNTKSFSFEDLPSRSNSQNNFSKENSASNLTQNADIPPTNHNVPSNEIWRSVSRSEDFISSQSPVGREFENNNPKNDSLSINLAIQSSRNENFNTASPEICYQINNPRPTQDDTNFAGLSHNQLFSQTGATEKVSDLNPYSYSYFPNETLKNNETFIANSYPQNSFTPSRNFVTEDKQCDDPFPSVNEAENFNPAIMPYNRSNNDYTENLQNYGVPINHGNEARNFFTMNKLENFIAPNNFQNNTSNFSSSHKLENFDSAINLQNNSTNFSSVNGLNNFDLGTNFQNTGDTFSSMDNLGIFDWKAISVPNEVSNFPTLNNMNNFDPTIANEKYFKIGTDVNNFSSMNELDSFNASIMSHNNPNITSSINDLSSSQKLENFDTMLALQDHFGVPNNSGNFLSVNMTEKHDLIDQNRDIVEDKMEAESKTFNFNGRVLRIPNNKNDNPSYANNDQNGIINSSATTGSNNSSNFDRLNSSNENINQQVSNILQIASVSLNQSGLYNTQMSRQQISNVLQIANLNVNENEGNFVKRTSASITSRTASIIDNNVDQSACKITQKSCVNIMKDYYKKRVADTANNNESEEMHLKYVTLAQQLCQAKNYDATKSPENTVKTPLTASTSLSETKETRNSAKHNSTVGESSGHFNVALYKRQRNKMEKYSQLKKTSNQSDGHYFTYRSDENGSSNLLNDSSGYETHISEEKSSRRTNLQNSAELNCRRYYPNLHAEQKHNEGSFSPSFGSDYHVPSKSPAQVTESRKLCEINQIRNNFDGREENITPSRNASSQYSTNRPHGQGYSSRASTPSQKPIGTGCGSRLFDGQVHFTNTKPNSMTISVKDDCFIDFNRKASQNGNFPEKSTFTSTPLKSPSASILKKTTKYYGRTLPSSESSIHFHKSAENNSIDELNNSSKDDASHSPKKVSFSPQILEASI